jgi:ABC-type nitrate/sulfonate/bicarbonate transport system substrate-binding protein
VGLRRYSMRKKYIIAVVVVFAVSVLLYVYLRGPRPPIQNNSATINIAGHTSLFGVPVKIAESKGLFTKHGLKASIRLVESSRESMAGMEAGDFDVVMGTPAAGNFNMIQKGDLIILADAGQALPIVIVRKDLWDNKTIQKLADLKGKSVMTPREGSSSSYALARVLQGVNLTLNDISPKYLAENQALAALEARQIDAAVLAEPEATNVLLRGLGVKLPAGEIAKLFPPNGQEYMVLYSRRKTLTEKADVLRKFLAAYLEAVQIYEEARSGKQPQKNDVITIMNEYTGASRDVLEKASWHYLPLDGKPNIAYLKQMQEYFVQQKLLDKPTDLDKVVHLDLLASAK